MNPLEEGDQSKKELSRLAEEENPCTSSTVMDMQSNASSSRNSSSKPGGYSGDESSEISDEYDASSNPSNSHLIGAVSTKTPHGVHAANRRVILPAVPIMNISSKQTEGDASISSNDISLTPKSVKDAKYIMDRRPSLINPVDPRIDLSCLNIICAKEHDRRKNEQRIGNNDIETTSSNALQMKTDATDSYLDAYSRLLESCQPFFKIYQEELKQQTTPVLPIVASAADAKYSINSSSEKKKKKKKKTEYDENDSVSSMIVLAPRPKNRKKKITDSHQQNQPNLTDDITKENQPVKQDEQQQLPTHSSARSSSERNSISGMNHLSSCSSQSSSSAISSSQNRELLRLIERGTAGLQHRQHSSTKNQAQDPAENQCPSQQGPRLVSESSGLNSGSATGTGSGTGSGNDTYAVKQFDMNSTEMTTSGDTNSNSDAVTKRSSDPHIEQDSHSIHKHSNPRPIAQPSTVVNDKTKSARERIALKKRKRMDQRKEIEDLVRRQMQTSSDSSVDSVFKPGENISMEDSLSFTGTARLVVQADPPYCAVHINAAFSRLTGIHNNSVIGTPISKILSLVSTYDNNTKINTQREKDDKKQTTGIIQEQEACIATESTSTDPIQGMEIEGTNLPVVPTSDALLSNPDSETTSIDPLIVSCGFHHYHQVRTLDIKLAVQPSNDGCSSSNNGSNNSSISSKDENIPKSCIMSICAVYSHHGCHSSTPSKRLNSATGTKKQKSFDTPSHYLIQLFPLEGNHIMAENISRTLHQPSTSRSRLDDDSQMSGTSTSSKPVAACG
jgi:hypothetical protein